MWERSGRADKSRDWKTKKEEKGSRSETQKRQKAGPEEMEQLEKKPSLGGIVKGMKISRILHYIRQNRLRWKGGLES